VIRKIREIRVVLIRMIFAIRSAIREVGAIKGVSYSAKK
jgi:hypothetical protein